MDSGGRIREASDSQVDFSSHHGEWCVDADSLGFESEAAGDLDGRAGSIQGLNGGLVSGEDDDGLTFRSVEVRCPVQLYR